MPSAKSTIQISQPALGVVEHVATKGESSLQFAFDPSKASFDRSGTDLIIQVDNGGKVVLDNFFAVGDDPLPVFVFHDNSVNSADVLKAFSADFDTSTAAGPVAASDSTGLSAYDDDGGSLVDGVNRLGSLGTDTWGRNSQTPPLIVGSRTPGGEGGGNTPGGEGGDDTPAPILFNARGVLYMQHEGAAPSAQPYDSRGLTVQALSENSGRWETSGRAAASVTATPGNTLDVNSLLTHAEDGNGNITFHLTDAGRDWMAAHSGEDCVAYYTITDAGGHSYVLQVVISADQAFNSGTDHNELLDPAGLIHGEWHDGKDLSQSTDYKVVSSNQGDRLDFTGMITGADIQTGFDADRDAWGKDTVNINGSVNTTLVSGGADNSILTGREGVTTVTYQAAADDQSRISQDPAGVLAAVRAHQATNAASGHTNTISTGALTIAASLSDTAPPAGDFSLAGVYAKGHGANNGTGNSLEATAGDLSISAVLSGVSYSAGGSAPQVYGVYGNAADTSLRASGDISIQAAAANNSGDTSKESATGVFWQGNSSGSAFTFKATAGNDLRIEAESNGLARGVELKQSGGALLEAGQDLSISATGGARGASAVEADMTQSRGAVIRAGGDLTLTASSLGDTTGVAGQGYTSNGSAALTLSAGGRLSVTAEGTGSAVGVSADSSSGLSLNGGQVAVSAEGANATGLSAENGGNIVVQSSGSLPGEAAVDIRAQGLGNGSTAVGISAAPWSSNTVNAAGGAIIVTAQGGQSGTGLDTGESAGQNSLIAGGSSPLVVAADGATATGLAAASNPWSYSDSFNSIQNNSGTTTIAAGYVYDRGTGALNLGTAETAYGLRAETGGSNKVSSSDMHILAAGSSLSYGVQAVDGLNTITAMQGLEVTATGGANSSNYGVRAESGAMSSGVNTLESYGTINITATGGAGSSSYALDAETGGANQLNAGWGDTHITAGVAGQSSGAASTGMNAVTTLDWSGPTGLDTSNTITGGQSVTVLAQGSAANTGMSATIENGWMNGWSGTPDTVRNEILSTQGAVSVQAIGDNAGNTAMSAASLGAENTIDGAYGSVSLLAQGTASYNSGMSASDHGSNAITNVMSYGGSGVTVEALGGNYNTGMSANGGNNDITNIYGGVTVRADSPSGAGSGYISNQALSAGMGGQNLISSVSGGGVSIEASGGGAYNQGILASAGTNAVTNVYGGSVDVTVEGGITNRGLATSGGDSHNLIDTVYGQGVDITVRNTVGGYNSGISVEGGNYAADSIIRNVNNGVRVTAEQTDAALKGTGINFGMQNNSMVLQMPATFQGLNAIQDSGSVAVTARDGKSNYGLAQALTYNDGRGNLTVGAATGGTIQISGIHGNVDIKAENTTSVAGSSDYGMFIQQSGNLMQNYAFNTISGVSGDVTVQANGGDANYGMYTLWAGVNTVADVAGGITITAAGKNTAEGMHAELKQANYYKIDGLGANVIDSQNSDVTVSAQANKAWGLHAVVDGENEITAGTVQVTAQGVASASGMSAETGGTNSIAADVVNITAHSNGTAYGMYADGRGTIASTNTVSGLGGVGGVTVLIKAEAGSLSNAWGMYADHGGQNQVNGGLGDDRVEVHGGLYALNAAGNLIRLGSGNNEVDIHGNMTAGAGGHNSIIADGGNNYIAVHGNISDSSHAGGNVITTGGGDDRIVLDGIVGAADLALHAGAAGSADYDILVLRADSWADFTTRYQGWLTAHSFDSMHIEAVQWSVGDGTDAMPAGYWLSGMVDSYNTTHPGATVDFSQAVFTDLDHLQAVGHVDNLVTHQGDLNDHSATFGAGDDYLHVSATGTAGGHMSNDTIHMGDGHNSLIVDGTVTGSDITAGGDRDIMTFSGDVSHSHIDTGAGNDLVTLHGAVADSSINLGSGNDMVMLTGDHLNITHSILDGGTGGEVLNFSGSVHQVGDILGFSGGAASQFGGLLDAGAGNTIKGFESLLADNTNGQADNIALDSLLDAAHSLNQTGLNGVESVIVKGDANDTLSGLHSAAAQTGVTIAGVEGTFDMYNVTDQHSQHYQLYVETVMKTTG